METSQALSVKTPVVYLAGPEVFMPDALQIGRRKCELAAGRGLEALFPLETAPLATEAPGDRAMAIFRANCTLMAQADGCVANLTPFRGPSADPGTVFEVGQMLAWGKPVVAYTLDVRDYRQRVAGEATTDLDGLAVEDFGLADNLMLACAIEEAGGSLLRGALAGPARREHWRDLALFDRALALWCERFAAQS